MDNGHYMRGHVGKVSHCRFVLNYIQLYYRTIPYGLLFFLLHSFIPGKTLHLLIIGRPYFSRRCQLQLRKGFQHFDAARLSPGINFLCWFLKLKLKNYVRTINHVLQ